MNQVKELETKALQIQEQGTALQVRNQEEYNSANELCVMIKGLQKEITDTFDPITKKAYDAWKEAIAQKDKHLKPLQDAEKLIKEKMLSWYKAEEAKRKEEERKLQEQADKKRKAEEDKAAKARAEGKEEKAVKHEEKASTIVAPSLVKTDSGTGVITKRWSARVYDKKALLKAILDGKAPENAVEPNMTVLNGMARAAKDGLNIPGVQAIGEDNIGIKTK